ncbi:VOC family protein [Alteribacter aurantiacus]|uniref:VOC family protein n=1 Tax=Alteribacter aurantiacus TaxID=254410 RepID=UPI0004043C90|nr:VOC family protein [Alteribacter aurantiacus]
MGKVIGFELNSQEPEKAAAFYENVFGWNVSEPQWEYSSVNTGEKSIEGGISKGPHDFPHGTRIQIEVPSIDEAIAKAKDEGAKVVREKMDFDNFYLAYLVDPTGVGFGLVEKK